MPASIDALSNLGLALQNAGRFEGAIAQYRNALALTPRHPEILYNLGNAFLALDRITEALASYDEVLAVDPSPCRRARQPRQHAIAVQPAGGCARGLRPRARADAGAIRRS